MLERGKIYTLNKQIHNVDIALFVTNKLINTTERSSEVVSLVVGYDLSVNGVTL